MLNFMTKIRMRQAKMAKRILPVFVAALFSTAIQPCAMAMGDATSSDCPHCPPAQTEHFDQNHHQAPCDDAGTQCDCDVSDPIDTRASESKLKDKPLATAVVFGDVASELPAFVVGITFRDTYSASHPGDPSLCIRYCVFLK